MATVTHLMRAPILGGSELETATLTRCVPGVRHRVVFPACFARLGPSIAGQFDAVVELRAVESVERELDEHPPELLHVQFPFVLVDEPAGHDSVLELTRLPDVPRLFTVHAAVNVPIVNDLHYVFHTGALRQRFADALPEQRVSVLPSPVELPDVGAVPDGVAGPDRGARRGHFERVNVLWVSRNDDAKFHPDVGSVCVRVLARCPEAVFRFVGRPQSFDLPRDPRVRVTPCPAPNLAAEYRDADLFWFVPHPLVEETWSRTTTEAMGWRLPCVVAAPGAMRFQVEDGRTGRVVDDLDACADALVELIRAPERRREWGAHARRRAEAFFAESVRGFADLYHRLAAGESPAMDGGASTDAQGP